MRPIEALRSLRSSPANTVLGDLAASSPIVEQLHGAALEMNLRASTILGLVGGDGLGQEIYNNVQLGSYPRLSTLILLVYAMVLTSDLDRGTTSLEGRMKTGVKGESRFENDASRYAAYLETPEGRLRADLAFANLQEFLPASAGVNSLRALDLGCGTGTPAVRLARVSSCHLARFVSDDAGSGGTDDRRSRSQ